jgi:hypothetical protein
MVAGRIRGSTILIGIDATLPACHFVQRTRSTPLRFRFDRKEPSEEKS